jgi:hypothetical protein
MPFSDHFQMPGHLDPNMLFWLVSLCFDRKSQLLPGCVRRGWGDFVIRGSGVRIPQPANPFCVHAAPSAAVLGIARKLSCCHGYSSFRACSARIVSGPESRQRDGSKIFSERQYLLAIIKQDTLHEGCS